MSVADDPAVIQLIALAKEEDLGAGDLTSDLLADPNEHGEFRLLAKQVGVVAGCEIAPSVLAAYDASITIEWVDGTRDGTLIEHLSADLATIHGPVGVVLSAERVLLNFLQRLCGVATLTRTFVDAVAGTSAVVMDTRKTTPGALWRSMRFGAVVAIITASGLYDAVLIKDNHLANVPVDRLAAAVFDMLNQLSAAECKPAFVEVEADTLAQVEQLLKVLGIDVILLDNFSLDQLREAVALRDGLGLAGKLALEASGGVSLKTVRSIAETGVDRISIGAITHSAVALDLSLERK